MENELIFIRHAKTKVDKEVPIENWVLTEEGEKQAEEIANSGEFDEVNLLICSNEDKSYLTIKPFADKLDKEIIRVEDLGEIKRPDSEKLSLEEYEDMKVQVFGDLDFTEHNWETANHALERFKKVVEEIDNKYENKKILICSHGTVMTLYFAEMKNELDNLMERWKNLEFGAIGIIKNGEVVRDIV